jgi:hypothetical protein
MQQGGEGGSSEAWGRAGEREGAWARRDMAWAAGIGPRPAGAGGGAAALQRRDESGADARD